MEIQNNKKNMDTDSENSSNVSYHKYDRKISFNLTVDDIQTLITGKSVSLTDASLECSHVVSLDDKAKTYLLKKIYKHLFQISDDDYEKAATHYDEYLAIFHDLVQGDIFDADNLRERIEKSNPWKNSGYSDGKYEFISLAGTDCDILAPLLIDNIENSQQEDAKEVIQARFKDFEHAFDGNFINPRVILLGINPKMSSEHDSYGLKDTVYKEPFNTNRPILDNDYYNGSDSIFYAETKEFPLLQKSLRDMIYEDKTETPVALFEFFPYASETETNWRDGYKIDDAIIQYFNFKKILPSQIWMVCLLTYTIKHSEKLFLFLRKNNKDFRNHFLNKYFEAIQIMNKENIKVLSKKSSKYLSSGNVKPYFNGTITNIRTDTVEHFFEDLWDIS